MRTIAEVISPGALSTIQDHGRFNHRQYGVPVSGFMDQQSAQLANRLVNNPKDLALLEVTLSGPVLQFKGRALVALTGADLSPTLNDKPLPMNSPFVVSAGSILKFGKRRSGCRAYLSVHGGFQTESVLDSRSFFEGITAKARLQKGDQLPYEEFDKDFSKVYSSVAPNDTSGEVLDVWAGPELQQFSGDIEEQLMRNEFTISDQAGRMGYRLKEKIKVEHRPPEMLTGIVIPGTVQLTPSGQLIVLGRDCQTTGGYPRVLQLKEEALNLLAQKCPGEQVRFEIVD